MYSAFQQHECSSSIHISCRMRWHVQQIYQSNSQLSQQPPPAPEYPHLQEDTAHTWNSYTLFGTAQEFHVHLLPQSCIFTGREWTDQSFTPDFPGISAEPSAGKLYPLMAMPTVEIFCRHILQDIFLQLFLCTIPLTGQDLPWTVLTSSTDPSISEWQVLLWQSNILSLSLRIWASFLVNDRKGKGFCLVFNQFYSWDNLDYFVMFFRSSFCLLTK